MSVIVVGSRQGRMLGVALLLAVVGLFLLTEPAAATTYTVNDLGDASDQTPADDVCLTAGGVCTLRAAIQEANAHAGPDIISFSVAGVISTVVSFPEITDRVAIDGLTAPGFSVCPLPSASLAIQLEGGGLPIRALRFHPGSDGSSARGLSITNFDTAIDVAVTNTTITCNYIGVEADGDDGGANGNVVAGITLATASTSNAVVGGLSPGDGNVIANNRVGIWITNGASGNGVLGNIIRDSTLDNIAMGGSGAGNRVSQNRIFNSGPDVMDLGIDLGEGGVTANDPGDTDTGSNNLQNFPMLTGAGTTATNTAVTGTLDSIAGETYRIELFRNTTCDGSGHGEGAEYLGFVNVAIGASNPTGIFSIGSLPATTVGHRITATATRTTPPFDTSEFSACAPIVADAVQPGPTLTVTTNADIADGVCSTLHCSLREAINRANELLTDDTIEFDIPGPAPHVITIAGSLPPVTDKVTINGLSQGDIACPLPTGALAVQIDGGATPSANVLTLGPGSDGSSIRGLSIVNASSARAIKVISSNNVITCNYLGLGANGSSAGRNFMGVEIAAGANNLVGGPNASDGNVAAHNEAGVAITGGAGSQVRGNVSRNNVVGMTVTGNNHTLEANIIANNQADGVRIFGDTNNGNFLTRNSISNSGTLATRLGIDILGPFGPGVDGVNLNDVGDADGGANNVQNFPVLARASSDGATTTVVGTLDSVAGQTYRVEFFSNPACHVSGHGEGELYLGFVNVTIDPVTNRTGAFSATLPSAVTLGQVVTATATRNTAPLDTSEFSACRAVTPPPGVTVTESGGPAVAEGGTSDTFQVRLNAPPAANVTIQLASSPAGQLQPIADLVFTPANWNVDQTVTVAAVDDGAAEGAHAAIIALTVTSTDTGYTGLVIPSVNVAITDNDTPGFTVSPTSGLTTSEAGGTATFTVRLNTVPSAPVTIALTSSDTTEGTIGPPFSIVLLTFTPANALTPQTLTVTGVQDAIADGHVAYAIVTGVATSADPSYNGLDPDDVALTNADDEATAGLAINDASAAEGDTSTPILTFAVTLNPPSSQPVTVQFATANGTATGGLSCAAGVDYLTTSGVLTFQPTETTRTVAVTLCPDAEVEGDETLLVTLSGAVNSTIGDGQGQGTIRNDDVAGGISFSAGMVSVPENAGSAVITVQRSGGTGPSATQATTSAPSGSVRPNPTGSPAAPGAGTVSPGALAPVAVSFATANGTATAGQDYVPVAGTLVFGANETTKTITIPILADNLVEGNEQFTVTLSDPTGGAGLGAQATITVVIVDTSHGSSPPPGDDSADDERVERERETEDERRQRARTNRGNRDDDSVEGDVLETRCDQPWPAVTIANRDGEVEVRLIKEAQAACSSIHIGDYLEADGEKQHEGLFHADSVEIKRRR